VVSPEELRLYSHRVPASDNNHQFPEPPMPTSFRQIIDKAMKDDRFLVVPGAHDALSARLIQQIGFESYFIGGFPVVGARYGVPDVGLKGFGEISAAVRDIMAACDLPAFVDGDDGYGDVKNVVHTVQTYERMGVSAILIEDQQWPKRCGHMVGKKVVATELAEAKIRAACSERVNPETWILARTDARAVYDIDEAMRRAERYIRAGADGIFIEAPRSVAELERIGHAFDVPQLCNPLMGGHTPILSMEEMHDLGFICAVMGLDTVMHAAKAIEAVLLDMKSGKFALRNDGMDFEVYKKVVGYDQWESVDERFAPPTIT
jgi:2-methylisocitrate lyase-like PEP mutase family enzyme